MENEKNHINSILRAIEMLGLFQRDTKELGVTEIARRMNLHKSSAHRIIRTLEYAGWLHQNPSNGKYKLGIRILDVAGAVLKSYDYREIITASMRELKDVVGETIVLSVYTNKGGVCIDLAEAENNIQYTSKLGHHTPVYSGATGKILLAYQSEEEVDRVVALGFTKYTSNTIVTEKALRENLADIREKGYATSFEETDYGVSAIGAPIFDKQDALLYGLSIVGPTKRLRDKGIETLIAQVVGKAEEITKKINSLAF